jgi:hypothetical protein
LVFLQDWVEILAAELDLKIDYSFNNNHVFRHWL